MLSLKMRRSRSRQGIFIATWFVFPLLGKANCRLKIRRSRGCRLSKALFLRLKLLNKQQFLQSTCEYKLCSLGSRYSRGTRLLLDYLGKRVVFELGLT